MFLLLSLQPSPLTPALFSPPGSLRVHHLLVECPCALPWALASTQQALGSTQFVFWSREPAPRAETLREKALVGLLLFLCYFAQDVVAPCFLARALLPVLSELLGVVPALVPRFTPFGTLSALLHCGIP